MSADSSSPPSDPVAATDRLASLRVECYVRSTVPTPISASVSDVVDRLRHLAETGVIADVQVRTWPSESRSFEQPPSEPTRAELVDGFEHWADQHGCSLEPAFHRREVDASFESEAADSIERLRVPLVALALYENDAPADADAEALRGVVPYTERSQTVDERTHTVPEWLSEIETRTGRKRPVDSA